MGTIRNSYGSVRELSHFALTHAPGIGTIKRREEEERRRKLLEERVLKIHKIRNGNI
jgi:hypothetical protein